MYTLAGFYICSPLQCFPLISIYNFHISKISFLLFSIFIYHIFYIFHRLDRFSDYSFPHGEKFMAIFTTPSVVIWFSTGTLGIFATLVSVFTKRVVIYDILGLAIIPTLSTSILFCNLCHTLLWILPRSVVKIAIRI